LSMRFYDESEVTQERVSENCVDVTLFVVEEPKDPKAFVRISQEPIQKPPEEGEEEGKQVSLTKVHFGDVDGTTWTEVCVEELEYHTLCLFEGAVPDPEAAAPEEDASLAVYLQDEKEVKYYREIWAFLPTVDEAGGKSSTFTTARVLDLKSDTITWSEPRSFEGDAPAPRTGHSMVPFRDGRVKAYLFGGADCTAHGKEDGAENSIWGYYNDTWVLDTAALSWSKCEFDAESVPFSLECSLGGQPLTEVEGSERFAALPASGPPPRDAHSAVVAPGTATMYVLGGRFQVGEDVGLKEATTVYSAGELWLLEEIKATDCPSTYRWSTRSCGGAAPSVHSHNVCVAEPKGSDIVGWSSTLPWKKERTLVLSGGVSDGIGGSGLGTLLYLSIAEGGSPEWKELTEALWRIPPPLAKHTIRISHPAKLVVVGGHLLKDGCIDARNDSQVWTLEDDGTVPRCNTDPFWSIFKTPSEAPSVEQLKSHSFSKHDRDEQHLGTLPHWAAMAGSVEVLEYLVKDENMSVNMRDRYGQMPLHVSCAAGTQPAMVLHLLDLDADVSAKDYLGGWTPLHAAARGGDMIAAEALCTRNVDVNAVADDGSTPLHRACAWCNTAVVEVLLKAGADRTIKNKAGNTALQELCHGRTMGTEAKKAIMDSFQRNYVV